MATYKQLGQLNAMGKDMLTGRTKIQALVQTLQNSFSFQEFRETVLIKAVVGCDHRVKYIKKHSSVLLLQPFLVP